MTAEDDDPDDAPDFPAVVRLAGALGLGQAALLMLAGVGLGGWAVVTHQPDGPCCVAGLVFLAGWIAQWHARLLLLGRTPEVGGFAGWALVWAAVAGGVAGWATWVSVRAPNSNAGIVAAVIAGLAVSLAVAGTLALSGRRAYLVWRAYHRPG